MLCKMDFQRNYRYYETKLLLSLSLFRLITMVAFVLKHVVMDVDVIELWYHITRLQVNISRDICTTPATKFGS